MSLNSAHLEKKWATILEHKDVPAITDPYRRSVVAQLLENQQVAIREQREATVGFLNEATNTTAAIDKYDHVLISLVRRTMPNIIAYDIAGVQPMQMPTGLIFAMKSLYKSPSAGGAAVDTEALFNAPDTAFSGDQVANDGRALPTTSAEALTGKRTSAGSNAAFGEMGFEIVKASIEAKSRALRASYTTELAQDLKSVHGLDAETELANILSTEILAEINREILNGVNDAAKLGIGGAGTYDLVTDGDGRWSVERYKSLIFAIEKEANQIALETRRGRGNVLIVSSNVASALSAASYLDHTPALQSQMNVDPTGNLFAGVLNGNLKVFIDPFAVSDYVTVGYRGTNPYDAGVFYCPYVPLTMMRAIGEEDFQPRIGFKTRYGIRANPFVDYPRAGYPEGPYEDRFGGTGNNQYFRSFTVSSL